MLIFFNKLQRKIFLLTVTAIFLVVSVFSIVEYHNEKKNLYQQLILHMLENSFTIRNSIESVRIPMLFQSILEEYAVNILEHKDIHDGDKQDKFEIPPREIYAVNTEGIVMASTMSDVLGLPLEDAIQHKEDGLKDVLAGKATYSIEHNEHLGVRVIDISVPIREDGEIIGALHYVEPYIKLETMFRESLLRHLILGLVLIIALSLLINLFLHKMVTRPIINLSSAMDRLRLRGASGGIEINSDDEIGHLARSFNQMSIALKDREAEVNRYTITLEKMVDERTKKLKDSQDQLIQTEKLASMGKLAGYIAHEINNPVGIIVSRAECILMDTKDKESLKHLRNDIEVIKKHSNRIATITRAILTFSRKSPVEFSTTDINEVIDETLLLLEKQFLHDNIHFKRQLDYSIPKIRGNANQLHQVFFNILNNARDSMPTGGEIGVQSRLKSSGIVSVSISDTGTGIPEEHLYKIFEPFFTTKKEGKGTGLGLSVTYGIIKDHNGQINVYSNASEGTTFEIMLPLRESHPVEV